MMLRVLLVSLCWSTAHADDLSRLFTTQQQRHELNNQVVKPLVDTPIITEKAPVVPIETKAHLNGFISSGGKTTVWINGEMKSGQSALNGEVLLNQGKQTVRLRPGQVFDPNTQQVKESFSDSQP